jgi:hypothetical protein
LVLSIPTNLIVLATGFVGAANHDPAIYLTRAEKQGIAWIGENIPEGAVVLSGPGTGLFIPAHSSARVLYGHPFETINAEEQEKLVTGFFQLGLSAAERRDFIDAQNISYIFYGPRERQLGDLEILVDWSLVFRLDDVEIYRMQKNGN